MKLNGDRNQCAGCGEFFNSSAAFDKHRVGAFGAPDGNGSYLKSSRRCLTFDEMVEKNMEQNSSGFWITASNPNFK